MREKTLMKFVRPDKVMLDKRGRAIRSTTSVAPSPQPTTPNNRSNGGMNHNPMTTSQHQQQQHQQQHIFSSSTNGGSNAIKRSTSRGKYKF